AHSARRPRPVGAGRGNRVPSCSDPVVGEQSLADDVLLDLAGALTDQQEWGISHQPLDLVFLRVAVAAVDPEALLGHFRTELTRQVFGHPRRDVVAFAAV